MNQSIFQEGQARNRCLCTERRLMTFDFSHGWVSLLAQTEMSQQICHVLHQDLHHREVAVCGYEWNALTSVSWNTLKFLVQRIVFPWERICVWSNVQFVPIACYKTNDVPISLWKLKALCLLLITKMSAGWYTELKWEHGEHYTCFTYQHCHCERVCMMGINLGSLFKVK